MEETHIPGAAVAVSHEGEPIYAKGFGVSDLATKKPVDPNTIFGIASVSKSFIFRRSCHKVHTGVDDFGRLGYVRDKD